MRLAGAALLLAGLGLVPHATAAAEPAAIELPLGYEEVVTGGADPEAPLPMIVVLHGRGGGAGRLRSVLTRLGVPARVVLPRGAVRLADGRPAWFGPRADGRAVDEVAGAVGEATADLRDFLGAMQQARPTCGKPMVVGWSQGGVLAFTLALEHPELVSRAVAVAGTVPERLVPEALGPHAPIDALHGMKDGRVSYQHTRKVVARLDALGFEIELHGYRNAVHEPDATILRDVRRLVTAEAVRLGADPSCDGTGRAVAVGGQ